MTDPARIPSLSARFTLPLVTEWTRRGHTPESLLAPLGLGLHALTPLAARIPVEAWCDLRAACIARTGDPAFPVAAACGIERNAFPLEMHLVSSQLTVRQGMHFARPFLGSAIDGLEIALVLGGPRSHAHFTRDGEPLGPPELAEYFLLTLWAFVKAVAPGSPPPTYVTFTHRGSRHGDALSEAFQAPVHFARTEVGFAFAPPNVEIPIPSADPEVGRMLAAQAGKWLSEQTAEIRLRDRARHWLGAHLGEPGPVGRRLAEAMHMSERNLRRRLGEEGTSLRELVDDVRRERAVRLLDDGAPNLDVLASELGFSSASALSRAFRRWTGASPSEYLRRVERG